MFTLIFPFPEARKIPWFYCSLEHEPGYLLCLLFQATLVNQSEWVWLLVEYGILRAEIRRE